MMRKYQINARCKFLETQSNLISIIIVKITSSFFRVDFYVLVRTVLWLFISSSLC